MVLSSGVSVAFFGPLSVATASDKEIFLLWRVRPKEAVSAPAQEGAAVAVAALYVCALGLGGRPALAQRGSAETVGSFACPRLPRRWRLRSLRRRRGRLRARWAWGEVRARASLVGPVVEDSDSALAPRVPAVTPRARPSG